MEFDKNLFDWFESIGSHKRKLKRNHNEAENINAELCQKCGGQCCKRCGCHFSPSDFEEVTFEYLKKEIEKGYISIDCVDGEMINRRGWFYILRTRNIGMPIVDTSFHRSPCILLTETGCKLDYAHRPLGGKMLIPKKDYDPFTQKISFMCHAEYDINECCDDWQPYLEIIRELVKYFQYRDFQCSL